LQTIKNLFHQKNQIHFSSPFAVKQSIAICLKNSLHTI